MRCPSAYRRFDAALAGAVNAVDADPDYAIQPQAVDGGRDPLDQSLAVGHSGAG